MALLLAMYQKMRLIREKNQLVLDQTKVSSKLSRVQKNIERVQKRYTSLFANLDSQAKMMQSQAKVGIQSMFGLGMGSVDPYNYGGLSGFVVNGMSQILAKGINKGKDANGDDLGTVTIDNARFSEMKMVQQFTKILMLQIKYLNIKVDLLLMKLKHSIWQCSMLRVYNNSNNLMLSRCVHNMNQMYLSGSMHRKQLWKQNKMQCLNLSTTKKQCSSWKKNKKIQDFKESTKKSKHTNNLFHKKSRTQLQPSVSDNNHYHNQKRTALQKGGSFSVKANLS